MAPISEPDVALSKVQSVIDFANHYLQYLLRDDGDLCSKPPDLSLYLKALPFTSTAISAQQRRLLNKCGVALWNTCSKFRRDETHSSEKEQLAEGRVLAYLLLRSALKNKSSVDDKIKIFEQALKAGKDCLEAGATNLASIVIESAAAQQQDLEASTATKSPSHTSQWICATSDYLLLRVIMAWKQGRLDLAEHFYTSIDPILATPHAPEFPDRLADALYEIGHSELQATRAVSAVFWLGAASKLLAGPSCRSSPATSRGLQVNTDHAYVRALLATKDPNSNVEAYQVLERLRKDHGHLLAVMVLRLEILSHEPTPNAETYFVELTAIIRTMHLIDANHDIVIHYLHCLRALDQTLAATVLKQYILQRLAPEADCPYTEGCVVMLTWMVACPAHGGQQFCAKEIGNWLDEVCCTWSKRLSAEACHGALVLLWKQVEKFSGAPSCAETIAWCRLMLHSLFSASDPQNITKVQRKLIECYIAASDYGAATTVHEQMSPAAQQQPLTRYLVFRIAMRTGPDDFVHKAVNAIAADPGNKDNLLLAAISETMLSGTMRRSAIVLHRLLDKYWTRSPPDVDLQTLLRCTTRLLISILADEDDVDLLILTRLCACFKTACQLYSCHKGRQKMLQSPLEECRWFFKQGYNSILQILHKTRAKEVIDMLHYIGEIHNVIRELQQDEGEQENLRTRRIDVLYLQIILYIAEARSVTEATNVDDIPRTAYACRSPRQPHGIRALLYQQVINISSDIHRTSDHINGRLSTTENLRRAVLIQHTILPYQFEALLHLGAQGNSFDNLSIIRTIQQAQQLGAPLKTFSLIADMVLSAATTPMKTCDSIALPVATAVTLCRHIITAIRHFDDYNVDQASRWIRCNVQLLLDAMRTNKEEVELPQQCKLLDEIVSQAVVLARSSRDPTTQENSRMQYPSDELEWLATTLFNLAVDLYVADRITRAQEIARRSVEVADVLALGSDNDQGVLAKVLGERCARLESM